MLIGASAGSTGGGLKVSRVLLLMKSIRRTIRKAVEDPAAERLIDGTLASGGTLVVDADENGEVVLK